jgi:colanic acid biosynthesis protein WcaH
MNSMASASSSSSSSALSPTVGDNEVFVGSIMDPVAWDTLRQFHGRVLTVALPRHPQVAAQYLEDKANPKFQEQLVALLREGLTERDGIWLRPNDYPYYIESSVKHYVIWFTADPTVFTMHSALEFLVGLRYSRDHLVICCNDSSLKSVPEVNHYHVFIRTPILMMKSVFHEIVKNAPLVSVDLAITYGGKFLLGRRNNNPAKGALFLPGSRVLKDETIGMAVERSLLMECGIDATDTGIGIGIERLGMYEHWYDNNFRDNSCSTQYFTVLHLIKLDKKPVIICDDQHSSTLWLTIEELLMHSEVHRYTKYFFISDPPNLILGKGCICN